MSDKEKTKYESTEIINYETLNAENLKEQVILIEGKPTLSDVGFLAVAKKHELNVLELNYKITENGVLVICAVGKAHDTRERWGCYFEEKCQESNTIDFQNAIHQSQIDGFKKCLFGDPLISKAIEKWKSCNENEQNTTNEEKQPDQSKQEQQTESQTDKKKTELIETQKKAIQTFEEHEATLASIGITREIFWTKAVPDMYKVTSRDKMTIENWRNIIASLELAVVSEKDNVPIIESKKYPVWINKFIPKPETDSETDKKEETKQEDIPF